MCVIIDNVGPELHDMKRDIENFAHTCQDVLHLSQVFISLLVLLQGASKRLFHKLPLLQVNTFYWYDCYVLTYCYIGYKSIPLFKKQLQYVTKNKCWQSFFLTI